MAAIITVNVVVNFNANGGSGGPTVARTFDTPSSFPCTVSVNIPTSTPSKTGWTFIGWSTNSSASAAAWQPGGTYSYTFPFDTGHSQTHTVTLYAVWEQANVITYRPGTNGTGSVQTQTKPKGQSVRLKGAIFTREHYTQVGWSRTDGGTQAFALNGTYSIDADITLYPVWKASNSTISSLSSWVNIGVSDAGTLTLTRYNSNYLHRVEFTYGNRSQVYTSVGTSLNFTIPSAWLADFPTSTSGVATCTVKTFEGSTLIGSVVTKVFNISVPASEKPSVSLSATYQSSNSTVNGWGVLVQNYSTITLTASATAPTGTTIDTITFSGDGVSQSGTTASATSSVLKNYGSREWTCTVKDKRGRITTVKHTATVYQYRNPSITNVYAERALSDGTESPAEGTYIKARATYSVASCNGNNSATVKKIEYKLHTDSSWSTGQADAASGTAYTFGGGNVAILNNYDVRVTVTDAVGNTSIYEVIVSSVKGVSFGLNGECARFGGPVQYDDLFECDWDTVIHGDLTVDGTIHPIGDFVSTFPSASSLTSGSWTTKANVQLVAGTWLVSAGCVFSSNASGYRGMCLSYEQNSYNAIGMGANNAVTPSSSNTYSQVFVPLVFNTNVTLYLNVIQNSGSSLTATPWIRAVRIR